MMLIGSLLGIGVAAVLMLTWRALAPATPRLDRELRELYEPLPGDLRVEARRSWQRWAIAALTTTVRDRRVLDANLQMVGETPENFAVVKLGFAVAGALTPAAMYLVWVAAGVSVPPTLVVPLALVLIPLGWFVPDLRLREQAETARRDFRHALSLWLELVVIGLACGLSTGTAMQRASYAGQGFAFQSIRVALRTARNAGRQPWNGLAELGERLNSAELLQLARDMERAGNSGTRQRQVLETRVEAARSQEFTDNKRDAKNASEKMGMPVMGLVGCLLALVLAPAIARLMGI